MKTLRILVTAFLAGVVFAACGRVVEPCLDRTIVVDTLGWVIRPPADTVGPITATHPACIRIV